MKKPLLIVISLFFSFLSLGQEFVIMKDGGHIPKSSFMKTCIESSLRENGDAINAEGYCSCTLDLLAKYFTSDEFAAFSSHSADEAEGAVNLFNKLSPEAIAELQLCVTQNLTSVEQVDWTDDSKRAATMQCNIDIKDNPELATLVHTERFCSCYVEKLEKYFKFSDLANPKLYEDARYLQMRDDCFQLHLK